MRPAQRKLTNIAALIFGALTVTSCGRTLPQRLTDNSPKGGAENLDLTKVNFAELKTGTRVNVADYMQTHNMEHLLLTFGSQSCTTCMEKAQYLETNLVDHYEIVGGNPNSFELHGVNTDPVKNRSLVIQDLKSRHLSHINWADGDGADSAMMAFFQPSGTPYSVPLSVLFNRQGKMLLRVPSTEPMKPEELLRRVVEAIGGDATAIPPQRPTPTPQPHMEVVRSALADEKPGRLKSVPMTACGASAATTVQDSLDEAGLKFVVVDRGNCGSGSTCDSNRAVIQDFLRTCQGISCKLATLGIGVKAGDAACGHNVGTGGKEFFDTFADLFNWNYTLEFNGPDGAGSLPEVAGPIVMAFDQYGKLVFSKEGAVTKNELMTHWTQDQFTSRAPGPAYDFFSIKGQQNFSGWRHQAKYSVVQLWENGCGACQMELAAWSNPNGGLIAWCAARPDFCQVLSILNDQNPSEGQSYQDFFQSSFLPFIDGHLVGNDETPYRKWNHDVTSLDMSDADHRWFSGWSWGRFNELSGRAVLYDREGKVVDTWKSTNDGTEPFDALKILESAGK